MIEDASKQTNIVSGIVIDDHTKNCKVLNLKIYNINNINNMFGKDTKFKNVCLYIKKEKDTFKIMYPSKYNIVGQVLKKSKFKNEENVFTCIIFSSGNLLIKYQ